MGRNPHTCHIRFTALALFAATAPGFGAESAPSGGPIAEALTEEESILLIGSSLRHRLVTTAPEPDVERPPDPSLPYNHAWPLISWFDQPVTGAWVAAECDADSDPLCNARWRRNEGLVGVKSRLEEWSLKTRKKMFGEKLGEHIELDLDSSPEIRFSVEFK